MCGGWVVSTDNCFLFGSTAAYVNNSRSLPRSPESQCLRRERSPSRAKELNEQVGAAAPMDNSENCEATHPISVSICAHSALTVSRYFSLAARDSLIADKTPSESTSNPPRQ